MVHMRAVVHVTAVMLGSVMVLGCGHMALLLATVMVVMIRGLLDNDRLLRFFFLLLRVRISCALNAVNADTKADKYEWNRN